MKAITFSAILFLSVFLLNCNSDSFLSNSFEFDLNDAIDVTTSQQVSNPDCKITIQIDSVLNDSRCPSNADCVWAGNASVRFRFTDKGSAMLFVLNTYGGENFPSDTVIGDYTITMIGLSPYPLAGEEIEQDEYVARLLIEK